MIAIRESEHSGSVGRIGRGGRCFAAAVIGTFIQGFSTRERLHTSATRDLRSAHGAYWRMPRSDRRRCVSAWKIGSDALLMTIGSRGADDARLQQIEFSSPIHLTLDQLELADLAFGLVVGPTQRDCGAHGGSVLRDAICEFQRRGSSWRARSTDRVPPEPFFGSWLGNPSRFRAPRPEVQRRSRSRRRSQSRPGESVASDRHQPGDGSGGRRAADRPRIHLFRSPSPSAPLADDAKASAKPLPLQRAP